MRCWCPRLRTLPPPPHGGTMTKKLLAALFSILAITLFVAGCGDDDSDESTNEESTVEDEATEEEATEEEATDDEGTEDEVTEGRSEENTSQLQSLMRISEAVFCLKKKTKNT